MKKNPILCLLLALTMLLTMTACQTEIPGIGTIRINDGSKNGHDPDSAAAGDSYDASLAQLREEMSLPSYLFAAALIGSSAGGPDDLELPIQEWVSTAAPELCAQYSFICDIPRQRVVGSGGSLFCVVPRDPDATLAVNRIRWNPQNEAYDNLEVLYRSESGDPILLYACADMGESPYPDTEVIVTDSTGKTVTWYPIYGITALPYDHEYDLPLGYSFTVCDEDYGGDVGDDAMWTAPTAEQLAGYVWTWQGELAEQPAMATMSLIDGGAQMELTMTRSGGRQYTEGEAPTTVSGTFPVQVPVAFDIFPVLNVAGGDSADGFPIQQIPYELFMFDPAQG